MTRNREPPPVFIVVSRARISFDAINFIQNTIHVIPKLDVSLLERNRAQHDTSNREDVSMGIRGVQRQVILIHQRFLLQATRGGVLFRRFHRSPSSSFSFRILRYVFFSLRRFEHPSPLRFVALLLPLKRQIFSSKHPIVVPHAHRTALPSVRVAKLRDPALLAQLDVFPRPTHVIASVLVKVILVAQTFHRRLEPTPRAAVAVVVALLDAHVRAVMFRE